MGEPKSALLSPKSLPPKTQTHSNTSTLFHFHHGIICNDPVPFLYLIVCPRERASVPQNLSGLSLFPQHAQQCLLGSSPGDILDNDRSRV